MLLFALTRVTHNPAAMQALHGVIGTASVALSPTVRRRDAWLLAFGYYFVFEFCAISRGYALCVRSRSRALGARAASTYRWPLVRSSAARQHQPVRPASALVLALLPHCNRGRRLVELAPAGPTADRGCRALAAGAHAVTQNGRELHVYVTVCKNSAVFSARCTVPLPDFTRRGIGACSLPTAATSGTGGHFTAAIVGVAILLLAIVHLRRRPSLSRR